MANKKEDSKEPPKRVPGKSKTSKEKSSEKEYRYEKPGPRTLIRDTIQGLNVATCSESLVPWVMRLGTVASLASFQAPSTLSRLIILAVGAGLSSLVLAATLFSPSQRIRCNTFWSLILGLFAFLSSRVWFVSFVPVWWNDKANSFVIALGFIVTIDHILNDGDVIEKKATRLPAADRPYWPLAALGFGSLLFLTHWVFGEVSLIARWVVKGYPHAGPQPELWGGPVIIRGLLLGIYTLSIWPSMINQVSACPPGCTLALANFVYIAEMLFSVWTVAYNFVPGGVYTREHTDWLVAFVMFCILLGLKSGGKIREDFTCFSVVQKVQMPTGLHKAMLLLIAVIGLHRFGSRLNGPEMLPPKKADPQIFSSAIWTYHFGYDNKGWPSLERSAEFLNNTGADVITLLESDASKPFLGNNDLGMWLGERLGMYVDFGPSTRDHTWGNLILSKYPIISSVHHLLPSPEGELAPAITATINISGQAVDFVVTHMGNDRDNLDRQLQASFLADQLKASKNPVVFMGYITSAPGSRDYTHLINTGKMKDIDSTDRERWCEYIMYRGLIRLGYARISHGGLSDTELQLGRFQIPKNLRDYKDNEKMITDSRHVDSSVQFNPV
ncbi:hypothetical protein C0Q70_05952 [Pomacea canaliculata]|uniref:PGAP2-interacting protein n=1 Tax=Pomacea canaliculata TaxID=400727 RepID=A0A2T7PMN1_POMCA|nr:hypothetical protein C0Q70_05952 [Pomacea canaliculata]